MKHTKIVDPRQDFWKSVQDVNQNVQHIERLRRQMDIDVRNMEAKGGEVDVDAYSSRIRHDSFLFSLPRRSDA